MRLPRWLLVTLNIYALILAAIMIWPFLQMMLTSVTSDIVFPPRYFSLVGWTNVHWARLFQGDAGQPAHGFLGDAARDRHVPACRLCD